MEYKVIFQPKITFNNFVPFINISISLYVYDFNYTENLNLRGKLLKKRCISTNETVKSHLKKSIPRVLFAIWEYYKRLRH